MVRNRWSLDHHVSQSNKKCSSEHDLPLNESPNESSEQLILLTVVSSRIKSAAVDVTTYMKIMETRIQWPMIQNVDRKGKILLIFIDQDVLSAGLQALVDLRLSLFESCFEIGTALGSSVRL